MAVEACKLADANCPEIKMGAAWFYYDVKFTVFLFSILIINGWILGGGRYNTFLDLHGVPAGFLFHMPQ